MTNMPNVYYYVIIYDPATHSISVRMTIDVDLVLKLARENKYAQ